MIPKDSVRISNSLVVRREKAGEVIEPLDLRVESRQERVGGLDSWDWDWKEFRGLTRDVGFSAHCCVIRRRRNPEFLDGGRERQD